MGFADVYFERYQANEIYIQGRPDEKLAYSIVIPCYNEPGIIHTLQCLADCDRPGLPLEIIVVINSSAHSSCDVIQQNQTSVQEIETWKKDVEDNNFRIHTIAIFNIHPKHFGVGLARKTGMDEALRRFNAIHNKDGLIISFDADTLCDKNYLKEIENAFKNDSKLHGAVIYFEHPVEGSTYNTALYHAVASYELYLRYFIEMLRYISFPYAFHTLGSCFCLRAHVYAKQGGMNKKQGGEDFYFLHKVFPLGHFKEINTTRVIPASRPSDRVPFGTGPVIIDFLKNGKDTLHVYDVCAFLDIKKLFEDIPLFYKTNAPDISKRINNYPVIFKQFLEEMKIYYKLNQINQHASNVNTFKHKFFQWFGAFMIVKYLNYSHSIHYSKRPVENAALYSLQLTGRNPIAYKNVNDLLWHYRSVQREKE